MSNTLGGMSLAKIAARTLSPLAELLVPLGNIVTDFSSEIADIGASVSTRVATQMTADDVSGGFTAADVTSTAKTITLDTELGKAVAFTNKEMSVNGETLLKNTFIPTILEAVGSGLFGSVIKLMTAAAFPSADTITAANFDSDDVTDIMTALIAAKVPLSEAFGILSPAYMGALCKDTSVKWFQNSNSDGALRRRRVGPLGGFGVIDETTTIPQAGTTTTQNLVGFFGARQALLMAARMPAVDSSMKEVVEVENVVIPGIDFPIQFQRFYVPKERKHYFAVATLFGVLAGPSAYGRRLISA